MSMSLRQRTAIDLIEERNRFVIASPKSGCSLQVHVRAAIVLKDFEAKHEAINSQVSIFGVAHQLKDAPISRATLKAIAEGKP